jgi:thiamine phosphate synthase YjbQ (UPF0047 family)
MKACTRVISISSHGKAEFIDITDKVRDIVAISGVKTGITVVFTGHSSCGIVVQEKDPALQRDFWDLYEKLFPKEEEDLHTNDVKRLYHHPDPSSPLRHTNPDYMYLNAHSHLRAYFLPPSLTFPVVDSKMLIGDFQTLFFVELDETRVRTRRITVHVLGE